MTEATPSRPASDAEKPVAIALILGASRGLGAACALELARAGWHIVAVARTTGALEELDDRVRSAGGTATLVPADITDETAMRQLCRAVHDRWGRVDLWLHCAIHAPPLGPAGHVVPKDWDRIIATNFRAPALLIGMIEPLLLGSPHGTAMFFDDPCAGQKFFGAYGSGKAAQIALARSWQAETARLGPRVLIETPAPMPTALRARFHPGEDRDGLTPCADEAARLIGPLARAPDESGAETLDEPQAGRSSASQSS